MSTYIQKKNTSKKGTDNFFQFSMLFRRVIHICCVLLRTHQFVRMFSSVLLCVSAFLFFLLFACRFSFPHLSICFPSYTLCCHIHNVHINVRWRGKTGAYLFPCCYNNKNKTTITFTFRLQIHISSSFRVSEVTG